MLRIRLRRMGTRNAPFYRVVVSDSRMTPTSSAIEEVGYYDPRRNPKVFEVDRERVDHWVAKGARVSDTVHQLMKRNPAPPTSVPEPASETAPAEAEA